MPNDFCPTELVQVDIRCNFVTKDVEVHSVRVSFAKILGLVPVSWFVRVQAFHELAFPNEHEVVEFVECVGSHLGSEVVGPTPDDRVEVLDDSRDVVPMEVAHFIAKPLPYLEFRLLTGAD